MMVILGVLAAIAVPTFLSQREKGFRAAMVSDLRSLVTAQEARAVDGEPMYTDAIPALRQNGYHTSAGVSTATVFLFDNGSPQYVACLTHPAVDDWLVYSSVDGVTTYSPTQCTQPT